VRALVTGGLGYIGHAVTVELQGHGYDVTVLSRDRMFGAVPLPDGTAVATADLRDRAALTTIVTEGGFDAVIHLGGLARARESFDEPLDYFDVNVGGTANLLHAINALELGSRPSLVYGSTTLVYGSRFVGAVTENAEPAPESPYADTKVAAERLISAHAVSGNLAATILRIFNVAGGVDGVCDTDPTRIIPNLLRVAAAEDEEITLVGNGLGMRDFVHVADVARAIRMAIDVAHVGDCPIYNIGSGNGTRIIDMVGEVEAVSGRTLKIKHIPQDGAPPRLIADISYARTRLKWSPERSDAHTIIADAWLCWPR
jgi:UDP-glucose 4-epimerase